MFFYELTIILCFCLISVTGQACDTSSDTQQCSIRERCSKNTCEPAISCSESSNCPTGLYCILDYCQPRRCNSTGECVYRQICQHDIYIDRSCVYPVPLELKEGSNVTLSFARPSKLKSYDVWYITWYREGRLLIARISLYKSGLLESIIPPHSPYYGRDKAEVNLTNGAWTLINLTVEDEGFYYYELQNSDAFFETELKYEYRLKLNVIPSATIQVVPDKPVGVGTRVTLTCTAVKVNTEFTEIYWVVRGRNESGTNTTGDGVLSISLIHEVTKEDEGNPITCVVVPRFTDVITVEKTLDLGNAPTGKPVIQVSTMGQYKGEKVSLTCEKPVDDGNPPCNMYIWTRLEGNINYLPNTKVYTFIMDELHQGNYTCQCSNFVGESEFSNLVEMLYLGEKTEIKSKVSDNKVGLIAGCVIGVLVLVVLVVVAVIICKKYNIKLNVSLNIHTITGDQDATEAGGKDNHVYEIPIHDIEPTNTDNNSMHEEPPNRPESKIPNGMPRHYVTPLNIEDRADYEEPVNRPESEMNQYDYIDENEMERHRQAGHVNSAFPTYDDVQVEKTD